MKIDLVLAAFLVTAPAIVFPGPHTPGAPAAAAAGVRGTPGTPGTDGLLYQLTEQVVRSRGAGGSACSSLTFRRFLDAGYLAADGTNRVLHLKGHPTSKVSGTTPDRFFYVSTPASAVRRLARGMTSPDWDAANQTLWSAPLGGAAPTPLARASGATFPGDVAAAPGGRYVVYPLVRRLQWHPDPKHPSLFPKFDPFATDSSLAVADPATGATRVVLKNRYNRRLFSAFHDFSGDGSAFYTVARQGSGFTFVRVSLATGKVEELRTLFPRFPWASVPWDEFFNRGGKDFNFASFSISPDGTRLVAHRDRYQRSGSIGCSEAAFHDLWVLALDGSGMKTFRRLPGYVSSATWSPDGSAFALSTVSRSGCFPLYLDAAVVIHARDGDLRRTLLSRPKSKITTVRWAPDGRRIAFDIYGTDLVGHLATVDVASGRVKDLLDTRTLGQRPDRTHPVTILLAGWIRPAR